MIAGGGLALFAAGVLAALAPGDNMPLMGLALGLLGVGWNLGLVGGSALLTDAIVPERRAQTQGAADLVMGVTAISGNLLRDRFSTLAPSASWAPARPPSAPS